jgi:hypothetical protein
MKRKKLALLGCSKSYEKAPFDDKSYEIWTVNEFDAPRWDIMFELHPMSVQNERELEFLKNCEKPIYVLEETPLVPKGIVYPLDVILEQSWVDEYFCCTFAYQIALAIYEGFEVIELWGMNAEQGSPRERTVESANIQHWLGIAKGRGIDVYWHDHPMKVRWKYGYDYHDEIVDIINWICRLTAHSIYREGQRHIYMGGANLPIRSSVQHTLARVSEVIACPDDECCGCLTEGTVLGDITCNECGKKFKVEAQ